MTAAPPPSIPPSIPPRKRPTSGSATRSVTTVHGRDGEGTPSGRTPSPRTAATHDGVSSETAPRREPAAPEVRPEPPRAEALRAEQAGPVPSTLPAVDLADDEEYDGPSPLATAVDRTSQWLRKAASATGTSMSAAYASLTRPRPKEDAMTANPAAPSAPARPITPGVAGATGATPNVRPATGGVPVVGSGPRRVRLVISRVDPWSVMKLAFLLSFALGIMLVVAVTVLWLTLDGLHVFTSINDLVVQIVGTETSIDVLQYVNFPKVLSVSTLLAVIDVFLLTALATIGAFLYNVVAALVGGLHVTMTDE